MNYVRAITFCAAVALTSGAFFIAASPAVGKSPIVVTAPAPDDIIVRHVSYADLNLAAAADQRTLNHRVGSAVTSLCTEAVGGRNTGIEFNFNMSKCGAGAWRGARPQIAQAVLRAQQLASTGKTSIAAVALTISLPGD